MNQLLIEKTKSTPYVNLNPVSGIFTIGGKSLPEDVMSFYKNIMDWLHEYLKAPAPETKMIFEMEYFNTASSKLIFEIIRALSDASKNGNKFEIVWKYSEDDDDTLEMGKDYESLVDIPFSYGVFMEE